MEEFKTWLKRSAGLGERSARDVVSRLRRASEFVKLEAKMDTADLLHRMSKDPEFQGLTISVRSQLRRAVRLYRNYEGRNDRSIRS
jgi:DNA (cytosine-5)-methyltransferase 1